MKTPIGKSLSLVTLAAVVAASILASAPAEAKKKKQPGDSGVEEALRFKAGDETGNEIKALKTELLVIKSEKQALAQLQRLEKKYTGTRMEPEILYRLAELYMRRARSQRFFEVHKNSEQVMSVAPKLVLEASEKAEIRKGIEIYRRIQEKFPRFRAMDVVIFNNAYAHQQLGEDKLAEAQLTKLIKEHSSSSLVPDAYLAVGEINFGRREFKTALENFRAIRKYPQARVYPYGLYKAAWTYYNMQDAQSGLKQLEEVVAFGRQVAVLKLDSKLDLRKEALGDMALFYGDVRPSAEAVTYFRGQSQELDAVPYIMRLVELYNRHSRFQDIEHVLKDVLKQFPDSPSVAHAHEELVWNYERMKQRANAGVQLGAFDKWCDEQVKNAPKPKKGEQVQEIECRAKITDATRKLSGKWHALWKKQGGPDDLAASAEQTYRLYLKNADAKNVDLPNVRYSYAELLFARNRFREASENYAAIHGYAQHTKIDAKVAHDAAYGALVSLEKATQDKWNDEDEKLFVTLSQTYEQAFPKGAFVFDLRFKRAFIAYEKERYDEAAPQFKKIGWTDAAQAPKESLDKVTKSQDLYLDILNIKKDFKGIKESTQALLKIPGLEGARTTQIEKIYREAYFSEIQAMEEKGDLNGAVEAYKKFALENTASELAPKAWWNASQLQFKMGDAEGGANTCYHMHKLFPKSSNGKDCLTKAAHTFESMGRLDNAGRVLLNLALVEPEKQDHWREVAADFFALSGSKDRAISMYEKLTEARKKKEDQVRLLEKAATLAAEIGDTKTLESIEARFSREGIEPQASRLIVEQAEEAFEKKDYTKAFNTSKRIISRDHLPKNLLARARFIQARVLEEEYRQQSLKTRADRVGVVLAIKTEKLEKAQKAYQSAINYGDPKMSVQALRKLAECYIDYATSVRGMTFVNHLPEKEQEAFRAELEQLSVPMEEKGIEAMNQALDAAKKAQMRDNQVAELQAEVDRLNMKPSAPKVEVIQPTIYVPKFTAANEVGS